MRIIHLPQSSHPQPQNTVSHPHTKAHPSTRTTKHFETSVSPRHVMTHPSIHPSTYAQRSRSGSPRDKETGREGQLRCVCMCASEQSYGSIVGRGGECRMHRKPYHSRTLSPTHPHLPIRPPIHPSVTMPQRTNLRGGAHTCTRQRDRWRDCTDRDTDSRTKAVMKSPKNRCSLPSLHTSTWSAYTPPYRHVPSLFPSPSITPGTLRHPSVCPYTTTTFIR